MNKTVCFSFFITSLLLAITACSSARDSSPTPTETNPPFVVSNSGETIYFPRQQETGGERAVMEALTGGSLVLVDNCIRLQYQGDDGVIDYLLIWPPDFNISIENSAINILDGNNNIVSSIGDRVRMGGGEIHLLSQLDQFIQEQVPPQCPGPYWIVGEGFAKATPYPSPSP